MFNNIKIGVKIIGSFVAIFIIVTVMMLSGAKVRMDAVHGIDSKYRQYIGAIRETGTAEGQPRENGGISLSLYCGSFSAQ